MNYEWIGRSAVLLGAIGLTAFAIINMMTIVRMAVAVY